MKHIFDQYGEVILGFVGVIVIIVIITAFLANGGFLSNLFSSLGNAAV